MKHRKILFVCTGNTCRSPMAEAAMKQELKKRRIRWYRVSSAGMRAQPGKPITPAAAQALGEAKIPFDKGFVSRVLTEKELREAHVVVCMTEAQRRALAEFPNVTSFSALCGIEIPDPYGQTIDVYRTTLRLIRECLPRVIQLYCPPVGE